MTLEFAGTALPLAPNDIVEVAAGLKLPPAVVAAVRDVESNGAAFLPDKRPTILFESHLFHSLTKGVADHSHPGISTPTWVRNYGMGGAHQYDRLAEAISINRDAALQSASWGSFQILGSNHKICGFVDVEAFVAAMGVSERKHLDAFSSFIKSEGLDRALAKRDWTTFARGYNGPGQVAFYANRTAAAFQREAARYAHVLANAMQRVQP